MAEKLPENSFFGTERIGSILRRIAQLVIIALAVGSGVGVNTYMARKSAQGRQ